MNQKMLEYLVIGLTALVVFFLGALIIFYVRNSSMPPMMSELFSDWKGYLVPVLAIAAAGGLWWFFNKKLQSQE